MYIYIYVCIRITINIQIQIICLLVKSYEYNRCAWMRRMILSTEFKKTDQYRRMLCGNHQDMYGDHNWRNRQTKCCGIPNGYFKCVGSKPVIDISESLIKTHTAWWCQPRCKASVGIILPNLPNKVEQCWTWKNETTEQIYPLTVYTNKLSFIPSMPCPPLFHQIFSMASCQMMSWWWEPCVTPEENLWNYHILLRLQFEARKLHQMKSPWNWRSSKLKDSTQEVTEKKSTQPPQLSPLGVVNLRPSYGGNLKAFLHHVAGNLAALQLALQAGEVPQILQKKQIQLIHIYICIYIYLCE